MPPVPPDPVVPAPPPRPELPVVPEFPAVPVVPALPVVPAEPLPPPPVPAVAPDPPILLRRYCCRPSYTPAPDREFARPGERLIPLGLPGRGAAAQVRGERGIRTLGTFRYTRFPGCCEMAPSGIRSPCSLGAPRTPSPLRRSEFVLAALAVSSGGEAHSVPFGTHDFQSCPFGHSGTSPGYFKTRVITEERVGVEPTLDLRPNLISNQALSATQPPLRFRKGPWRVPYLPRWVGRAKPVRPRRDRPSFK